MSLFLWDLDAAYSVSNTISRALSLVSAISVSLSCSILECSECDQAYANSKGASCPFSDLTVIFSAKTLSIQVAGFSPELILLEPRLSK